MFGVSHLLIFLLVSIPSVSMAMTAKARNGVLASPGAAGRIELFFKSPADLQDRVRFLRSSGIVSFNLVNKDKRDDMEGWIDSIREVYPEADISAHYSLKHNKVPRKGLEEHKALWLENLGNSRADEILMISGSGPKKQWNTLEALGALRDAGEKPSHPKIAVAYNPYFPSEEDLEKENRRLVEKLETGCVSKIYLQFGTDLERLQRGLDFLQTQKTPGVSVAGSLFLPTKKLIAQQKFRPWNGVFLSPDFLEGPEEATAIVLEIIRMYQANNVELLWEAPGIRTEKDMGMVRELLVAAGQHSSKGNVQEDVFNRETKRRKQTTVK
mmetsp:Transcript_5704/g.13639  ORF Transcript_5704/g.13639 Transcript_5704/m.13639 type:complete len:326 (+) Transcript_5704:77-1054(+)